MNTKSNNAANDEILLEADSVKPGRTINFAEKMHLVLSNKECQGASIACLLPLLLLSIPRYVPFDMHKFSNAFVSSLAHLSTPHATLSKHNATENRRHIMAPLRPIFLHNLQRQIHLQHPTQVLQIPRQLQLLRTSSQNMGLHQNRRLLQGLRLHP